MKACETTKRQSGFFDLGLSLAVLAIAGGSLYLVEANRSVPSTSQPPAAEVSTDHQSEATLVQQGDS